MANIQAALNSMLSSAAGMGFVATQTPEYKERGEIKVLKHEGSKYNKTQDIYRKKEEELQKEKPQLPQDRDMTPEEQEAYNSWKRRYTTLQKDYGKFAAEAEELAHTLTQKTQDPHYIDVVLNAQEAKSAAKGDIEKIDKEWQDYQYEVDKRRAEEEYRQAEREAYEAEQEMKAITTLGNKADTYRNQSNELKVRLDLLSAKERGQLTTMYNRQQKKMTKEALTNGNEK